MTETSSDYPWLAAQAAEWAPALDACSADELEVACDGIFDLPKRCLSLLVPLPPEPPAPVEQLCDAIARRDRERILAVGPEAIRLMDTPSLRTDLGHVVLSLKAGGALDEVETAVALLDLASPGLSDLVAAGVCEEIVILEAWARTVRTIGMRLGA